MDIRTANLNDAGKLLEIYAYYVKNTAVTFEYEVPGIEEFKKRMENTMSFYPFFVAIDNGELLGYAYINRFRLRAAYDHSAETTVYVKQGCQHKGIGKKLYTALEEAAKAQNITNLYACIAAVKEEDEYLTNNSAQFHEHMGYRLAGRFENCAYKFCRWYDMVYMEKIIGGHVNGIAPIIPYNK